jgi:glycosyltransferase involved in cell wall biosynthesis
MKISIIIPCCNNSQYLPGCLESALRNINESSGEIICVDDCSTDDTLEVLESFAKRYASIKIVRHSVNGGSNEARRTGVLAATGDYVLFVDPDDKLMDGVVDVIQRKLAEKLVDVLCFDFKFADGFDLSKCGYEDSKIRYYKQIQKGHLRATSKTSAINAIYSTSPKLGVMVWGKAWRRELLVKGFSLIPKGWCVEQEDDCQCLMFLVLADSVSMIDYIGYEYRFDTGVTNDDLTERSMIRYLRNAVFVTRFKACFKKQFGNNSPYISSLRVIEDNVLDKYRKIAKRLLNQANDRDELLAWRCFDNESSLMWAMYAYEREKRFEVMSAEIRSIPILGFLVKIKRVYLKIRLILTKNILFREILEEKRLELKKIRAFIKESSIH